MAAADRVAGDHRDHRLRQAADLDVQVADVEAADALLGDLVVADVAVVAADPLVAARAEGLVAGAGEDDRADLDVVAGATERVAQLGERLRPEGVADLGPVDRDPARSPRRARRGCPRTRRPAATRSARRAPRSAGRPCAGIGHVREHTIHVAAECMLDNWLAQRAADLPRPRRAGRRRDRAHLRGARGARRPRPRGGWPPGGAARRDGRARAARRASSTSCSCTR